MDRPIRQLERLRNLGAGIRRQHFPASARVIAGKSYPTRAHDAYDEGEARAWGDSVGAGLGAIFPAGHAARWTWDALTKSIPSGKVAHAVEELREVLAGIIRATERADLDATVRAETLGGLLNQAEALRRGGSLAAAVGLAGAALEAHLRHLTERAGLFPSGPGSIAADDALAAQSRQAGAEVYSAHDGRSVLAWNEQRTAADRRPADVNHEEHAVELMILGIRNFIERTSSS